MTMSRRHRTQDANHVPAASDGRENNGGGAPPLDPPHDFRGKVPEEEAWFGSNLFFAWMRPLFGRAAYLKRRQAALQQQDLLPLPRIDHSDPILSDFEGCWKRAVEEYKQEEADPTSRKNRKKNKKRKQDDDDENEEEQQRTDLLRKAIFGVVGRRFLIAGCIKVLNTVLQFSFPLLLNAILKFIERTQSGEYSSDSPWYDRYRGYWLSALLFGVMASKALTENAYFFRVYRAGYQARVAVSTAVYHKALRLSAAEKQSTTLGELVNIMQIDASKIEMFIPQVHVLWDGLFQIFGYLAILYSLIGWPCFAGLAVMMAAGPVQGVIMKKLFGLNRDMVKYTDSRVKTTNEALQGMQSVKMFAWEDQFHKRIGVDRDHELSFLKRIAVLRGASRSYMSSLPGLVAVTSFVVYATAKSGADITASTLFAALVAFEQLRFPLLFYPMALAQLAQASVSGARVQKFLGMKEVGSGEIVAGRGSYSRDDAEGAGEIEINNATVYWSDPNVPIDMDETQHSKSSKSEPLTETEIESTNLKYPKAVLKSVSMKVETGSLCAVIGPVATGKSTLCSAVLNEALLDSGDIFVKGKIAYASQSPWILNATLRDNILFGLPLDQVLYEKVLKVCQLSHDLDMLDDGDLTEIGEKGINLSGGQKQRVSVARAAYAAGSSAADTIILDDPLSALDPEVASKLFHECIVEFMKGKTILLVTNQLQFLHYCDSIVALRHGRVVEKGSYDELISDKNGELKRLLNEHASKSQKSSQNGVERDKKDDTSKSTDTNAEISKDGSKREAKALVTKEERSIGAVSLSVYIKYIQAGGGFCLFAFVYLMFVLATLNGLASSIWISYWTSDAPEYEKQPEWFYLVIYAAIAVMLGVLTFIRAYALVRFGARASKNLHANLLNAVLRAPQSFFDTTPLGRIISRFSKDLYSIDIEVADMFDFVSYWAMRHKTMPSAPHL